MELRRSALAAMECSLLSIERMVMSERAPAGAEERSGEGCPRANSGAVFCYSCAWVLQGNLAPRGWGGGQRAVRPISPRSLRRGEGGRARAGGGWGVRSFPMVLQSIQNLPNRLNGVHGIAGY